ncbi:MAG: DUF4340 domain-containing protein [Clostridiales bacterium]|nr:DUF4340 domain-containing protein [Clostridiales bacterium]
MKILSKIKALFSRGEKTTLQKQARLGIIFLAVAVIGAVIYFAVIAPVVNEKVNYVPALYDGEELYGDDTILMMPRRTRGSVSYLDVKNKSEHYRLVATDPGNEGTDFVLEGNEGISLNATTVSSTVVHSLVLVTNSPKLGSQDRVNERATDADMRAYGLDAESNPVTVTVSLTDGTSYTVYIGDLAPAGDGYYAAVEGRRNKVTLDDGTTEEYYIVYSLTKYVSSDFVSQKSAALVNTVVMPYFSNSIYQPKVFLLERRFAGDNDYTKIVQIHAAEVGEAVAAAGQSYVLDYPKGYLVEEDTFGSYVLSSLEYLSAEEIIAYGDDVHKEEVYSKYGLDLDISRIEAGEEKCFARLLLKLDDISGAGKFESGVYAIFFGDVYYDDTGAGHRYAYSPYSDTIFTVAEADFEYVSWRAVRYISARMFYDYITSLDYLELVRDSTDIRYSLTGNYLSYHVDVTKSGDDAEKILRNGTPLTFDAKPVIQQFGSYTQTKFTGEFENFRKLFYVLITREFAVDAKSDIGEIATAPSGMINIKTTARDQDQTYYRYDKNGNRIIGDDGRYATVVYDGGFIVCKNVKQTVANLSGGFTTFTYDTAYYNEKTGRFFLKEEDRADGNEKPKNYSIGENGHLTGWTYLTGSIEAEYSETLYSYNIYDVYYDYTDADGNVSKRVNQTYAYVAPTISTYTYKINSDGTQTLADEQTVVSDGLYMRLAQIDKLFNDSDKLLAGIEIDKFGAN